MRSERQKHRWVAVGPLPPPVTGQSVAFQCLVDNVESGVVDVVDLSCRKRGLPGSLARVLHMVKVIVRCTVATAAARRNVYLTMGQSRASFFRDLPIVLSAALARRRIICHLHGGNYGEFYSNQNALIRMLIRFALRRAKVLAVLSAKLTDMFDFDPSLSPKVRIVPNGLPFSDRESGGPMSLPNDSPVRILFLSNLIPSKGYQILADAVKLLAGSYHVNVHCKFCGTFYSVDSRARLREDAESRQRFLSAIAAPATAGFLEYCGEVSGEQKLAFLREAHFFVLPTTYVNEGQPVSIIEAMAFGTVVITTDHRANSDLVQGGVTGLLVPPYDARAIADAVFSLIRDPERYAAMSRNAFELYRQRFTHARHISAMRRLLDL
ncbi:MAG: glycosyl transferase group 1 [Planctomycetaceae bacterium]|jgi:glycosyltransferase involved in cell wall biosynthesis|nr:glycosyl transferase group 1 [Planctomycetaceae bacterium]